MKIRTDERPIRMTGSKRPLASFIYDHLPQGEIYYEPFLGGGSVLYHILKNNSNRFKEYYASDINEDLISLWNLIKTNYKDLSKSYRELWIKLNNKKTVDEKKDFYISQRDTYNKTHDPYLYFFVLRTCYNGMMRYNSKGEFNTAFHLKRPGMHPDKVDFILEEWSNCIQLVNFFVSSYEDINYKENSVLYLDPPYAGTGSTLYFGNFDNTKFLDWVKNLNYKYVLSYDGNIDINLGKDVKEHLVTSGKSCFKHLANLSDENSEVFEKIYIKERI